jgi:uroporphyrinogen-III synthase
MRVLVTRPQDDATEIAQELKARGHQALIAPLLEIRFRDGPEISLDGVQAVLATSANGVRALARRTSRRDVPVFVVGPQSAAAARDLGFAHVRNADGDAIALAVAASRWASPASGALLHAAGEQTKGGLVAELRQKGFDVRSHTLYEAVAAGALPEAAAQALRNNQVDAVLLFSPRSARVFASCVDAAGLQDACGALLAVCISAATAEALAGLHLREIRVAGAPNQEAVLAALG